MATRKEQVDAFSFARRRMVSNMVVPTSTGSDEFAPRPVRTFLTSFMIGAVAIAAVVVLGVLRPSAPSGWQNGLAVDSASGADYIYSPQDDELHQMYNTTSAKLLLGGKFQVFNVPDSVINGPSQTIGAAYGIFDAPPDVPAASNVDLTQWSACEKSNNAENQGATEGRTVLEVGYGMGSMSPLNQGFSFIVHDASQAYMIDGDYEYPIGDTTTAGILTGETVKSAQQVGPFVPDTWLSAFEPGGTIQVPMLTDVGGPTNSGQPGQKIGEYGTSGKSFYIQTQDSLVEVSSFTYFLYTASADPGLKIPLTQGQVTNASVETNNATSLGGTSADWPQIDPSVVNDTSGQDGNYAVVCASFTGSYDGGTPHLALYSGSDLPHPLGANGGILQSVANNPQLANVVDVESGHAAIFQVAKNGSSKGGGTEFLLPSTGTMYPLAGKESFTELNGTKTTTTAAAQLGYDHLAAEGVPASFAQLVQTGSMLDPIAAGQTPTQGQ